MMPANYTPIYACMYPELAEQARSAGWALAVHGSIGRDFDLIYVPWVRIPVAPKVVVEKACSWFGLERVGEPVTTYHGREVFTVKLKFGEAFLDMSFMPTTVGAGVTAQRKAGQE